MSVSRPLLIFDGDCGFCRKWIRRWEGWTQGHVDYAPYQEVGSRFPQIPVQNYEKAVQLVEPSGRISSAAEAVFRSLATVPRFRWLLSCYERVPGFALATEFVYRRVANNRVFFSWMTQWF